MKILISICQDNRKWRKSSNLFKLCFWITNCENIFFPILETKANERHPRCGYALDDSFHNFSRYCPQNNFIQNSWLYNFELKSDVMIFFWLVCCAVHKNIFHNLVYFLMLLCFVLKMMTEKFFFSNFVRRREMETAKTLIGYIVSIICIIW